MEATVSLPSGKTVAYHLEYNTRVKQLKQRVAETLNTDAREIDLLYLGTYLPDGDFVQAQNLSVKYKDPKYAIEQQQQPQKEPGPVGYGYSYSYGYPPAGYGQQSQYGYQHQGGYHYNAPGGGYGVPASYGYQGPPPSAPGNSPPGAGYGHYYASGQGYSSSSGPYYGGYYGDSYWDGNWSTCWIIGAILFVIIVALIIIAIVWWVD